jgi:hypothetical protein
MDRNELAVRELGQISDPLSFVVMEQIIKAQTAERAVGFRPSSILSGGLDDWKRGRQVKKDVNVLFDELWLNLVSRVTTAYADMVEWQARAPLRELQFAEELRNELRRFETVEKKKALFYHELELEKIRTMNQGADPSWKIERTITSFDEVYARLSKIAQSESTQAEKHQQSTLLVEAIKSGLHSQR